MLAPAARAARTVPRRRRQAARRLLLALAARRRAPAAALVVLLCASAGALAAAALAARRRALVAARAAAARAARRWAGSGAASTSLTIRRYCCFARCRTTLTSRPPTRCRRSGRCPARRPAATASRWSRPPTRAACTSGRRRGVPLLCCGLPLFWVPYQQYRSRAACYRCIRTAGIIEAAPANGTYMSALEPVLCAECQCNFAQPGAC